MLPQEILFNLVKDALDAILRFKVSSVSPSRKRSSDSGS